jgi:hypothetical protein
VLTLQTIVLAAGEPSKVAFYLIGGVLAAGAVGLAFIGLSDPTFPGGDRGARSVMLLSLVVVVATIAAAIATSK